MKKVSKSLGLLETDPENSGDPGTEDTLRAMGFLIDNSLEVGKSKKSQSLKKGFTAAKQYHMLENLIPDTLKKC